MAKGKRTPEVNEPQQPNTAKSEAPGRADIASAAGSPGAPIAVHAFGVETQQTETLLISPYITPTDLAAYLQLDPEIARRLVDHNLASISRAAEEEAKENEHRRELEKADQKAEIEDRKEARLIETKGQHWAGVVSLGGFVLCGVALWWGYPTAASVLGCTMIVTLVAAFIAGRVLSNRTAQQPNPPSNPSNDAQDDEDAPSSMPQLT